MNLNETQNLFLNFMLKSVFTKSLHIYIYITTHNQISITKYLKIDNLKQNFQVLKYYSMDENGRVINIVLDPFNLNCYLHHNYCEEGFINSIRVKCF